MKPFTNKHSIAAGSPFHMGGSKKSPLYQDDLRAGEKIEGRPTTEVSKTGDVFKGLTTTVKTTQPVVRTEEGDRAYACLLYTSPSPRDGLLSRMPSSA